MANGRRDFLVKLGVLGAGSCLPFLLGCGEETVEPQSNNNNNNNNTNPNPPPPPSSTPFENYVFGVDSPPNKKALFELGSSISDSNGELKFSGGWGTDSFWISTNNGTLLPSIKGKYLHNRVNGVRTVFVEDENAMYLPNFSFPYGTGTKAGSIITMDRKIDGLGIREIFVKKLDESLPLWDWEKVDDKPGSIYLGDWTFDEIKNFNTTLKKGSLIITTVAPNPVSVGAFGVLSTSGAILEGIDSVITIINHISPGSIDKNKKYAWYHPFSLGPFISLFDPASNTLRNREEDIKDFFPSEIGNSWRYTFGGNFYESRIKGLKNVKGKNLFVSKGIDGVEEYFGYYGDKLNHYGFNLSGIGNVFFNPPIIFGDSRIKKGKNFSTTSNIICENFPSIVGNVQESFFYEDREVVAPMNRPYGGCFRIKEQGNLQISNGSQTINDSNITNHWYAKNVGRVRSECEGSRFDLYDYDLKNLKSLGEISDLEKKVSFSGRIGDAIKSLI